MCHANVNVNLMEQNVIQANGAITINVDASVKNIIYMKKNMFGIQVHIFVKNGKYLASIIDDSVITCDEVIESCDEETKTIPKNLNEKNVTCKTQSFYILLNYLLIPLYY